MKKADAIIVYVLLAAGIFLIATEPPIPEMTFLYPQLGIASIIGGFVYLIMC